MSTGTPGLVAGCQDAGAASRRALDLTIRAGVAASWPDAVGPPWTVQIISALSGLLYAAALTGAGDDDVRDWVRHEPPDEVLTLLYARSQPEMAIVASMLRRPHDRAGWTLQRLILDALGRPAA